MKRVPFIKFLTAILLMVLGSCELREEPLQPVACFTVSADNVYVGDEVHFTNCSTNGVTYNWDFNDGSESVAKDPTHTFENAGTFKVKLIVYNKNLADETEKTITVSEKTAPVNPETWDGISVDYYTILYGTKFDEAENWIVGTTETYAYLIDNGTYHCYRSSAGISAVSLNTLTGTGNWEIESRMGLAAYDEVNLYNNGLIWGCDTDINFQFLNFDGSGKYIIGYYFEKYNMFKEWTAGAAASPSYNLLTVRKYDNKYYMFINKNLVYTGNYKEFYGYYLGFFIASGSELVIDNFYVYNIDINKKSANINKNISKESLQVNTPNNNLKGFESEFGFSIK